MAKVGLYLKGARGKLAGAVLQKGPKSSTIIREKVNPSNPQSNKQLEQRIKLANADLFYRAFDSVLNHAFQGVKTGNESRLAFLKSNIGADGPAKSPLIKGSQYPYPQRYVISKGSLRTGEMNFMYLDGGFAEGFVISETEEMPTAESREIIGDAESDTRETSINAFRKIFGLPTEGLYQVTFLIVTDKFDSPTPKVERFSYRTFRMIIDKDATDDDWAYLKNNGLSIHSTDGAADTKPIIVNWEDLYPVAIGVIVSHWDTEMQKWEYSTSKLSLCNEAYYDMLANFTTRKYEDDVFPTWRKAKKSELSDLYLQAGEQTTDETTGEGAKASSGDNL